MSCESAGSARTSSRRAYAHSRPPLYATRGYSLSAANAAAAATAAAAAAGYDDDENDAASVYALRDPHASTSIATCSVGTSTADRHPPHVRLDAAACSRSHNSPLSDALLLALRRSRPNTRFVARSLARLLRRGARWATKFVATHKPKFLSVSFFFVRHL